MAESGAFHAIADPTRRAILDALASDGPTRAGDMAARFPRISRPAVSKHLRVLHEARLVRREARGREIWYELSPAPLSHVHDWVADYEKFWTDRLQRLKEATEKD